MAKYISLIRRHEAEMKKLHQAVREAFESSQQSTTLREEWQRAATRFRMYRSEVDNRLDEIETEGHFNWEDGREFVFDYFRVDPMYFRSGYVKEMLLKYMMRLELTENEAEAIRELVVRRIEEGGKREFRKLCRLIPRIQTPKFKLELATLLDDQNPRVVRRAEIANEYLVSP